MPSDGERPWHIPEGELRLRGRGGGIFLEATGLLGPG